jgi:D-beta-D-heptose 7-phosphate kinase / D-beta-D-heptose 1-phosphate adenosyltransferase
MDTTNAQQDSQLSVGVGLTDSDVLVIGDVMLDEYIEGTVQRVSPEAPVPVVRERGRRSELGGAANVARGVTAAGGRAWLVGKVGADPAGRELARACEASVVRAHLVVDQRMMTTRKIRVVVGKQQIVRIDREETSRNSARDQVTMLDVVSEFISTAKSPCIIISDYAKGLLSPGLISSVIRAANDHGIPVVVDPKGRQPVRYAGATVLKPNLFEALNYRRTRGASDVSLWAPEEGLPERRLAQLCYATLKHSRVSNVVVSLGKHGVIAAGDDLRGLLRVASRAEEVADVSGAGDTLVAFLGMALSTGASLADGIRISNTAAGIACGKSGTAAVGLAEVLVRLRHEGGERTKELTSIAAAGAWSETLRLDGKSIVLANGCFDLLHAGHLQLLTAARREGDVLIVAVNSDESVRALKGDGRPLQPLADRIAVLSGLEAVDAVVSFNDPTPANVIHSVRPNVLVKGGDYSGGSVVGAEAVRAWGGRTVIVPLLRGRSTTRLLRRSSSPNARS